MTTENPQLQRILIVEDEDNARKGYEALLRKWNWAILGVGSGAGLPLAVPRPIGGARHRHRRRIWRRQLCAGREED